ncbi:porin [Escherichia coli]
MGEQSTELRAVAQYQFDFGLRPSVAYLQSKVKTGSLLRRRRYPEIC